eukprot:765755-Hanusia_phi.AAC.1
MMCFGSVSPGGFLAAAARSAGMAGPGDNTRRACGTHQLARRATQQWRPPRGRVTWGGPPGPVTGSRRPAGEENLKDPTRQEGRRAIEGNQGGWGRAGRRGLALASLALFLLSMAVCWYSLVPTSLVLTAKTQRSIVNDCAHVNGWMPKDPACMAEETATSRECCPANDEDHGVLVFTPGGLPCCVAHSDKQSSRRSTGNGLQSRFQQLFGLPPFQNSGPPWHLKPIVISYKYEPAKRKDPPQQSLQMDREDNFTFAPGYADIPSSPNDVLLYPRRAASVWVHAGMNDAPGTTLDQQRIALNLLQPEIERKQRDLEMEFRAAQTGLTNFTNSENISVQVVNAPLALYSVMQRSKAMIDEIKNWSSSNEFHDKEKNLSGIEGDNTLSLGEHHSGSVETEHAPTFLKHSDSAGGVNQILKKFHDVRYHGMTYIPVFIPDSPKVTLGGSSLGADASALARPDMNSRRIATKANTRHVHERVRKIVQKLKKGLTPTRRNISRPKAERALSSLTASEAEKIHEIAEKLQKSSKQDAFRSAVHNLEKAENDLVSAMTQNRAFHKQLASHIKHSVKPRIRQAPSIPPSIQNSVHKVNMLQGNEQNEEGNKADGQKESKGESPPMYPEDEHVGSWFKYDRNRHLKRLALDFCHGQFVTRHEVMFCLKNILRSPDEAKQEASLRNDEVDC